MVAMSVLRSRSSLTNNKVFLLSGLSGDIRKDLAKKISLLGGIYFDIEDFKAHCTHVICGRLSRSEKFLGACATGKWVLHPEYITQSTLAKDWLDEEQFEWCDENILKKTGNIIPCNLAYAARRWRFMLGSQNGAFSGWKVAVVAGAKRSKIIKRLLISGGAEVFNMKIPIKNPEKVANTIGYIFVSEQNVGAVAHLLEYGVLCIRPEFIGDYLIKDPPADPMDYLVQVNHVDTQEQSLTQGTSENSFLLESQIGLPSSNSEEHYDTDTSLSTSHNQTQQTSIITIADDPSEELVSGTHSEQTSKDDSGDYITIEDDDCHSMAESGHSGQKNNTVTHVTSGSSSIPVPGPSGAASQTGSQDNKIRQALTVNKSLPAEENNRVSSSPIVHTDSSGKKGVHTVSYCHLSKASDESKVKRTRTYITGGEAVRENSAGFNVAGGEPARQNSLNDTTAIKNTKKNSDIKNNANKDKLVKRCSKRLQTNKTEPIWKDLIPKKGSSANKVNKGQVNKLSKMVLDEMKKNQLNQDLSIHIERVPDQDIEKWKSKIDDNTRVSQVLDEVMNSKTLLNPSTTIEQVTVEADNKYGRCKMDNMDDGLPIHKDEHNNKTGKLASNNKIREMNSTDPRIIPVEVKNSALSVRRKPEAVLPSTSVLSVRKKRSRQDADLHAILKDIKRQKISQNEWRPTVFTLDPDYETKQESLVMPMALTEIIHSSLDERLHTAILDELSSKVSQKYIPQPKTLHAYMVKILLCAESKLEANKTYHLLMKILHHHPPRSQAVQDIYRKSLTMVENNENNEDVVAQGADWSLIKNCISNVISGQISSDVSNTLIAYNSNLLLQYLIALIEQDLKNCVNQHGQSVWTRPLILRVLWSPAYHVVLNSKCRELLDLMTEALICLRTSDSTRQKEGLLDILKKIVWLVAMATECSRLSEGVCIESLSALNCERTQTFIHEIARRIENADIGEPYLLEIIFSSLQFPWLCVGVAQQLLNSMDDYLLAGDQVKDMNRITLSNIVSRYFFLLPKFNVGAELVTRYPDSPAKKQRSLLRSKSKRKEYLVESRPNSLENIAKMSEKINKKNSKGETSLHTACIKNDVTKLKQLLKVPGVDVNMKDNAGWTPLHEACNHGSIQCVQELLKFVPAKTMEHYFKKDITQLRKLDLLAKTDEGITPLHDAVLNISDMTQLRKVDLLAKTDEGITPLHDAVLNISDMTQLRKVDLLAKTDEGITPLHDAVLNISDMTQLRKVDLLAKTDEGITPLHDAVLNISDMTQLRKVDLLAKTDEGITPLHDAVLNISDMTQLRKVDLLAKTDKGITPLHDAVLNISDMTQLRKVDLLAKTDEGITPLHDAVLNNQIEVSRLLLQHGGAKLLSAETCLNYTPLQLAETDEMFSLLSSFQPVPRRQSDSQEMSFSQDSMMSVDETRTELPPDHLYEQVTMNGDVRIFTDKQAMLTFIHLVTCLLKYYIKAIDAETVRERIMDRLSNPRTTSKSKQRLYSATDSQNKELSQRLYSDTDSQNRESSEKHEFDSQNSEMSQRLYSESDSQNKESSQEMDVLPSEMLTPTDKISFGFMNSGEQSDKENTRVPFSNINQNVFEVNSSQRHVEIKTEVADKRISKEMVRSMKKDLKILRGLSKHIDMFKCHLEKICAKDDMEVIETALLEIYVMLDNFQS